jgi:hypothetical protein
MYITGNQTKEVTFQDDGFLVFSDWNGFGWNISHNHNGYAFCG